MSRNDWERLEQESWRAEMEYFAHIEKEQPMTTHKLPHNVTENTIPF